VEQTLGKANHGWLVLTLLLTRDELAPSHRMTFHGVDDHTEWALGEATLGCLDLCKAL
jgi:hypothetical protein